MPGSRARPLARCRTEVVQIRAVRTTITPSKDKHAASFERLLTGLPLALITVDHSGNCRLVTPLAAEWLAPLLQENRTAKDGRAINLVDILSPLLPPIGTFFQPESTDPVSCSGVQFSAPSDNGSERSLFLSVFRIAENQWLAWLTDAEPDPVIEALLARLRNSLSEHPCPVAGAPHRGVRTDGTTARFER